MSRLDADLVAVRDLPPGVVEPSDEAVARVWRRIATPPAPSVRRWPSPRLWVPIVAAAAVLVLMVGGFAVLRPHVKAQPAGPRFSSNPAKVAQVFADLTAVAQTANGIRLRNGQLIYNRDERVFPGVPDGRLYTGVSEQWITPDRLASVWAQRDFDPPRPDLFALRRSEESATYPPPTGTDTRPWAKRNTFGDDPTDPAAARREFIEEHKIEPLSDDRKVWDAVAERAIVDPMLSVARRLTLYRLLAELPVSVGETTVDRRRLVVIRFVEGEQANDLLFDPFTGRFAGSQAAYFGSDWADVDPAFRKTANATPRPTSSGGVVLGVGWPVAKSPLDPAVYKRDLWSWGVVEEIGERP